MTQDIEYITLGEMGCRWIYKLWGSLTNPHREIVKSDPYTISLYSKGKKRETITNYAYGFLFLPTGKIGWEEIPGPNHLKGVLLWRGIAEKDVDRIVQRAGLLQEW